MMAYPDNPIRFATALSCFIDGDVYQDYEWSPRSSVPSSVGNAIGSTAARNHPELREQAAKNTSLGEGAESESPLIGGPQPTSGDDLSQPTFQKEVDQQCL